MRRQSPTEYPFSRAAFQLLPGSQTKLTPSEELPCSRQVAPLALWTWTTIFLTQLLLLIVKSQVKVHLSSFSQLPFCYLSFGLKAFVPFSGLSALKTKNISWPSLLPLGPNTLRDSWSHSVQPRLALNWQRFSCLGLLNARRNGIITVSHYAGISPLSLEGLCGAGERAQQLRT